MICPVAWIQTDQPSMRPGLQQVIEVFVLAVFRAGIGEIDDPFPGDIQGIGKLEGDAVDGGGQYGDLPGGIDGQQALIGVTDDEILFSIELHSQGAPSCLGKRFQLPVGPETQDLSFLGPAVDTTLAIHGNFFRPVDFP